MAKQGPQDEEKFRLIENLQARLTERQMAKITAPNVTKMFTRKMIQDAFLETFELVGGVSRLAIWANDPENYETFLRLLMILAPKEANNKVDGGKTIEYRSMVPPSNLNQNTKKKSPLTVIDEDITDV